MSLCHSEMPHIYGTCDTPHVVANMVKQVVTYDVIKEMFENGEWKREWWCWPLRWIMDIVDVLAFAEDPHHPLINFHPQYYSHLNEFGVSTLSGILKVFPLISFIKKKLLKLNL